MGSYTFTLDKFHISRTRARHNDTDTVSFGIKVGNNTAQTQIKHMGDVNDGDHNVGLQLGPFDIEDSATPVILTYTIVNAGNKNVDDQLGSSSQAMMAKADSDGDDGAPDQTSMDGTDGDDPGVWSSIWKFATEELIALLNADCDGPVASNRIAVTASQIDQSLGENDKASFEKFFAGTDSATGCGSNSKYTVTYSVSRTGPPAVQLAHSNVGVHTNIGLKNAGFHKKDGLGLNVEVPHTVGTGS
jgi:hypothetical protein